MMYSIHTHSMCVSIICNFISYSMGSLLHLSFSLWCLACKALHNQTKASCKYTTERINQDPWNRCRFDFKATITVISVYTMKTQKNIKVKVMRRVLEYCFTLQVSLEFDLFSLHPTHNLKGQFTPKSKIHITFSAVYQSKLFWCELSNFGDISSRDFCLLSNIMELNGAHSSKKYIILKNSTVMSLSINHDAVRQR